MGRRQAACARAGRSRAWLCLMCAGLHETAFAMSMKLSEGFTRPWSTVAVALATPAGVVLLSAAPRDLPIGAASVVRTGTGAAGTATIGMIGWESRTRC